MRFLLTLVLSACLRVESSGDPDSPFQDGLGVRVTCEFETPHGLWTEEACVDPDGIAKFGVETAIRCIEETDAQCIGSCWDTGLAETGVSRLCLIP